MVSEFLERHAKGRRDYESFVQNTGKLKAFFKGRTLQEITPRLIDDFMAFRLSTGVSRAKSPGRTRYLTGEDATTLLSQAPNHLQPVLLAGLHTGGRLRELLLLRWQDIDLERGVLYTRT